MPDAGEPYIALECACGYISVTWAAEWPENMLCAGPRITEEAIVRLVCRGCGRKGRPRHVSYGWSQGPRRPKAD